MSDDRKIELTLDELIDFRDTWFVRTTARRESRAGRFETANLLSLIADKVDALPKLPKPRMEEPKGLGIVVTVQLLQSWQRALAVLADDRVLVTRCWYIPYLRSWHAWDDLIDPQPVEEEKP